MNLKQLTVAIVLLLVVGLTAWLQELVEIPETRSGRAAERHDPDYFIDRFVMTTMDDHGSRRYRLKSEYLAHYPDDDSTELTKPRITLYRKEGTPWLIRSDRGWVSAEGELVLLSGDVTIERTSGPENRPVTVYTDDLRIRPKDQYAETDKHVVMISQNDKTEAIGLRAYIQEGRLQLLDDVKVYYE